jgi:uncharacterized protein with von Willebrand factor type A (vWA) domain
MEDRIARFVAGLRASGVRVSIAESEDAWQAITLMGVIEKNLFRLTLRSTLVKDSADFETFDELFPLYFGTDVPPLMNPQAELSEEQQQLLQEALEEFAGDLEELLNWLLSGQGPTQEEMEQLAQEAGCRTPIRHTRRGGTPAGCSACSAGTAARAARTAVGMAGRAWHGRAADRAAKSAGRREHGDAQAAAEQFAGQKIEETASISTTSASRRCTI